MEMPEPSSEITLIETFADTKVVGLTINHENLDDEEIGAAIAHYERELGLPATDPLTRSPERLAEMVIAAFPELQETPPVWQDVIPAVTNKPRLLAETAPRLGQMVSAAAR
jgi:hypothetical protein